MEQSADALTHVFVRIVECLERPPRLQATFLGEFGIEARLVDFLESAVGVVDEHDLARVEETLGQNQRAHDVVGDDSAGVANDVCVAVCQAQHLENVHSTVHARDDREMTSGCERQSVVGEFGDELLVVDHQLIGAGRKFVGAGARHVDILPEVGPRRESPTNLTPMTMSTSASSGSVPMGLEAGSTDPRFDVFGRLMKNRVIMLGTDVNDDMANQICAQLLYLEGEDPNADIWLYINSPGGSITAGMAIYDTMQFVSCDVATVCMGLAASMGQFLLTAGTKGKRYTLPNARIMMHQPLAGLRGQATDIAIQAEQLAHIKRKMAELTSLHSGKPIEQIQADSERDRWFTAEEAQQYGLVDKVIVKRGEIR